MTDPGSSNDEQLPPGFGAPMGVPKSPIPPAMIATFFEANDRRFPLGFFGTMDEAKIKAKSLVQNPDVAFRETLMAHCGTMGEAVVSAIENGQLEVEDTDKEKGPKGFPVHKFIVRVEKETMARIQKVPGAVSTPTTGTTLGSNPSPLPASRAEAETTQASTAPAETIAPAPGEETDIPPAPPTVPAKAPSEPPKSVEEDVARIIASLHPFEGALPPRQVTGATSNSSVETASSEPASAMPTLQAENTMPTTQQSEEVAPMPGPEPDAAASIAPIDPSESPIQLTVNTSIKADPGESIAMPAMEAPQPMAAEPDTAAAPLPPTPQMPPILADIPPAFSHLQDDISKIIATEMPDTTVEPSAPQLQNIAAEPPVIPEPALIVAQEIIPPPAPPVIETPQVLEPSASAEPVPIAPDMEMSPMPTVETPQISDSPAAPEETTPRQETPPESALALQDRFAHFKESLKSPHEEALALIRAAWSACAARNAQSEPAGDIEYACSLDETSGQKIRVYHDQETGTLTFALSDERGTVLSLADVLDDSMRRVVLNAARLARDTEHF